MDFDRGGLFCLQDRKFLILKNSNEVFIMKTHDFLHNLCLSQIMIIYDFIIFQDNEGDLKTKVDLLQLTLLRVRCETEAEMRRLAREVDEKNQVLRQLRRQLEEQSDYKELQHQAR